MTKGSDLRPVRRLLAGFRGGNYVVELRGSTVSIRPKYARRGGPAEVTVTPGAMYVRVMMAQAESRKAMKRRARRGSR